MGRALKEVPVGEAGKLLGDAWKKLPEAEKQVEYGADVCDSQRTCSYIYFENGELEIRTNSKES